MRGAWPRFLVPLAALVAVITVLVAQSPLAYASPGLKKIHDPRKVTYSIRLKSCHARDSGKLPDRTCTPGSIDPAVTPEEDPLDDLQERLDRLRTPARIADRVREIPRRLPRLSHQAQRGQRAGPPGAPRAGRQQRHHEPVARGREAAEPQGQGGERAEPRRVRRQGQPGRRAECHRLGLDHRRGAAGDHAPEAKSVMHSRAPSTTRPTATTTSTCTRTSLYTEATAIASNGASHSYETNDSGYADIYLYASAGDTISVTVGGASCTATAG